jgi:protein O-mannosyl-transferase
MSRKAHRRAAARPIPPRATGDGSGRSTAGVWLSVALIVLVGALAYANSLSGPFILDDDLSIVTSPYIRSLTPLSRVLFPERESPVAGRPVVNVSLALNYRLGGLAVRGYHLGNVAIHILCALLLFGVVRRTLNLPALWPAFGRRSRDLAFASALIWMLHPLNTEAVDYVTERTESLMGLFYLLTFYAAIRAIASRRSAAWQAAAVVSCALGMGCKESMATAPFMVVLYDRVFVFDSLKQGIQARWRLYGGLAVTWLVVAAMMWSGPRIHSTGLSSGVRPWTYLLNQVVMIVQYLRLSVWPRSLIIDYGIPVPLTLGDVMPQALLIVLLLLLVIAALVWRPKAGFLGAWFFVTLAPTSSIVPIATWVGAERRMYLPLMAIVVLLVVGVTLAWDRWQTAWASRASSASPRLGRAIGMAALATISVLLGAGTLARNREYSSALSLARTVLDRRPHARAHHWLGRELIAAGHRDEGIAQLREAISGDSRARYTLGLALFQGGELDEAIEQLEGFVREQPMLLEVLDARNTIGRALVKQGKPSAAAEQFRLVLKMVPSNAQAHALLADVLLAQQQFTEAVPHYREYLKSYPNDATGLGNLGIALAAAGQLDDAVGTFRRIVDLHPQDHMAQRNLANALLSKRDFDGAVLSAQRAITLKPDDPVVRDILGLALVGQDKLDEAIVQFQQAVQLDPTYIEARDNLALASKLKREPGAVGR